MNEPTMDDRFLDDALARAELGGSPLAEYATALRRSLNRLTRLKTSAKAMVERGTTADELKVLIFVETQLVAHELREFQRSRDDEFEDETHH